MGKLLMKCLQVVAYFRFAYVSLDGINFQNISTFGASNGTIGMKKGHLCDHDISKRI